MKSKRIYYIIAILSIIIITIGGTYAFFNSSTKAPNNIATNSKKFEVIYSGGGTVNGPLEISSTKESGLKAEVNIRMAPDSALAKGTIYINIEEMSDSLANSGFIWEVYKDHDLTKPYSKGSFEGYDATTNNVINVVEDYQLSTENTTFTIYFWLNGNDSHIDNRVIGAKFQCYIGARTENFSGITVAG